MSPCEWTVPSFLLTFMGITVLHRVGARFSLCAVLHSHKTTEGSRKEGTLRIIQAPADRSAGHCCIVFLWVRNTMGNYTTGLIEPLP